MSYALPFVVFAALSVFLAPWIAVSMLVVAVVVALVEAVLVDDAAADRERMASR